MEPGKFTRFRQDLGRFWEDKWTGNGVLQGACLVCVLVVAAGFTQSFGPT